MPPAQPHSAVWFKDGNIVLATDEYLFRVHQGVLSHQSSAFRDMFDLSDDGDPGSGEETLGMASERYEGVPMVTLAGDKGDDVVHLLRTVYERRYYDKENDQTPLGKIIALLLLSSKYDFKDIQIDVIKHICKIFPTTLKARASPRLSPTLFGGLYTTSTVLTLLDAAYEANIEILLPTLFYECSDPVTSNYILHSISSIPNACSLGKVFASAMGSFKLAIAPASQYLFEEARRCAVTHQQLGGFQLRNLELLKAFYRPHKSWEHLQNSFKACDACKPSLKLKYDEQRQDIWDQLPSFFGLRPWKELRAALDY